MKIRSLTLDMVQYKLTAKQPTKIPRQAEDNTEKFRRNMMMKLIHSSHMGKNDFLKSPTKHAVEFHSFIEQTFIKHL